MNKIKKITYAWLSAGLLAGCLALTLSPAQANLMFNVNLDTTPLVGNAAGPFSLDFQLISGGGGGTNTAIVSHFNFGGGSASGSPTLIGGASGDLLGTVTLMDSTFFNEFFQPFIAGHSLSFDVNLTTQVAPGPTPDAFSFAILDSSGFEIPTTSFSDALVLADISSLNPPIQTFAGDSSAPGGIALSAPTITSGQVTVPEPGTLLLLLMGLGGWALAPWRLRGRPHF
jgi:hypothetical protein